MSDPKPPFFVPHVGGVKPGVLDPTQPARILRNPTSVLIFATYDPAAFATIGLHVALPPNARIIVEHTPGPGQANWFRLIPPPRFGPGIQGEDGSWPKVILLNGKSAIFEREQWEIYKLDPAYDCFLPSSGELPTITWIRNASGPPVLCAHSLAEGKEPKCPGRLGRQAPGYASAFSSSTSIARSVASGSSAGFTSSTDSSTSTTSTSSASSTSSALTVRPGADQPAMTENEFRAFLNSSTFKGFMATISQSGTSARDTASPAVNQPSVPLYAPGGASAVSSSASTMNRGSDGTSAPSLNPQDFTMPIVPPHAPHDLRSFDVPPGVAKPAPASSGPGPVPFAPLPELSKSGFVPTKSSVPQLAPSEPAPRLAQLVPTAEFIAPTETSFVLPPMATAASFLRASTAPPTSTSWSMPSGAEPEAPRVSTTAPLPTSQSSPPCPGPSLVDMSEAFARDLRGPPMRPAGSHRRTSNKSKKAVKPYARPPRPSTSGPIPEPFFMSAPSNRARHPGAPHFPEASVFSFQVPMPKRREKSESHPMLPSPVGQVEPEPSFCLDSFSSETLWSSPGTSSSASSSSTVRSRAKIPEIVDLTMEDEEDEGKSQKDAPEEATGPVKRKRASNTTQPRKRGWEVSPDTERADADLKNAQHKRDQRAHIEREEDEGTKDRDARLWQEIFDGVRRDGKYSVPAVVPQRDDMDVDHDAAIELSKQKLADLDKDRLLWNEEALKRAATASAEEVRHEKARQDTAEAERCRQAEAAAEAEHRRQAEAAAEEERRAAEAVEHAQCIEQERRETRSQQHLRWSPWNLSRTIPRYVELSKAFDGTKFTPEHPVDPLLIPWPVLRTPFSLQPPDIEWSNVEAFFSKARGAMTVPQYKVFVAASNIRFHPDTWRKSGIFTSEDKAMNAELKAACTVISQALTLIWKASRTL